MKTRIEIILSMIVNVVLMTMLFSWMEQNSAASTAAGAVGITAIVLGILTAFQIGSLLQTFLNKWTGK